MVSNHSALGLGYLRAFLNANGLCRNYWLVTILSGLAYITMVVFLPETYAPRLLQVKARKHGIQEPQQKLTLLLRTNVTRPIIMFLTEPILFLLSLYMAFIYGILYLDFTAYPYVFQKTRHWDSGLAGLSFLGKNAICFSYSAKNLF
jgi:hypothetical protein